MAMKGEGQLWGRQLTSQTGGVEEQLTTSKRALFRITTQRTYRGAVSAIPGVMIVTSFVLVSSSFLHDAWSCMWTVMMHRLIKHS